VTGIDFNPATLSLANKHKAKVAQKIGWDNVEFRRGRIQDLKTDLDGRPLVADESIDVIVSNCVLNLVRSEDKQALFKEMYRVLKKGGRVAISDIVSDEVVPEDLRDDPKLWSGCVSGAFEEKAFLKAFEDAGFYGIQLEKRDEKPWQVVQGIEFRSVTVVAYKGKEGACWEKNQAVIYKGPWKEVRDDDGHVLKRGVRTVVCDKTFQIFSKEPYRGYVILVPPRVEVPLSEAGPFDCSRDVERSPRETKGLAYKASKVTKSTCMDGGCC
jgi:SAM-dependent methyltransferase